MKSTRGLFFWALACTATVGAGCAAGSETTPPPPAHAHPQASAQPQTTSYATVAGYCEARARAECSAAVMSACTLLSESSCLSARKKSCLASVPQGTTYQPSKAPACVAAAAKVYKTDVITAAALNSLDEVCGPILFAGPGAARASCLSDYDCNSAKGLKCVPLPPSAESVMGECFVPMVVAPGGDCSAEGTVCSEGNFCDPQGMTCIVDAQLGGGCNPPSYPCAKGLSCNAPGSPFATCVSAAGGADGMACNADTDCTFGLCDKAKDQAGGTCQSSITLSPLDSLCVPFE